MLLKKSIPLAYIFSLVKYRLLFVALIAGSISHYDGDFEKWGIKFPIIPEWLPGLLGTSITLILAFRTNQSYDRWWESRKIWGAIVNDSRTLIRELKFLKVAKVDVQKHKQFEKQIHELLVVWLHSLKDSLRNLDITEHRKKAEELGVKNMTNLPHAVLVKMQEILQNAYEEGLINDFHQTKFSATLTNLTNSMGACERIKNTVFPLLYSNTIDFAIWLFVILFPLAFRDPNDYVEFPVVMLISMIFMLLEKVAIHIQDPFQNKPTDVPMNAIVYGIETMVRQTEDEPLPKELEDYVFYQL